MSTQGRASPAVFPIFIVFFIIFKSSTKASQDAVGLPVLGETSSHVGALTCHLSPRTHGGPRCISAVSAPGIVPKRSMMALMVEKGSYGVWKKPERWLTTQRCTRSCNSSQRAISGQNTCAGCAERSQDDSSVCRAAAAQLFEVVVGRERKLHAPRQGASPRCRRKRERCLPESSRAA